MPKLVHREPQKMRMTINMTQEQREILREAALESGYKTTARWARDTLLATARGIGVVPGGIGGQIVRAEAKKKLGKTECEFCGKKLRRPKALSRRHSPTCMRFMATMEDK